MIYFFWYIKIHTMLEDLQKQKDTILQTILSLKAKNPLGFLFAFADIKNTFITLWEYFLNSFEINYSPKTQKEYLFLTEKYKQAGIFEALYSYYLHTKGLRKFAKQIDDYFENAFFVDNAFYFYTLSQMPLYKNLFEIVYLFARDETVRNEYIWLTHLKKREEYLGKIYPDFLLIGTEKERYFLIQFLNSSLQYPLEEIQFHGNEVLPESLQFFKKFTQIILRNKEIYRELYQLFLKTFVENRGIDDVVIEKLEDKKLFEVIAFLKNDLHSGMEDLGIIDYEMRINIKDLVAKAKHISKCSLEEKIDFILQKEDLFLTSPQELHNKVRLTFKRELLEQKYGDIIDLILWITDIPSEVYYLLKTQTHDVDMGEINFYLEIKDLIVYIEKSYMMSFLKPFLLQKISRHFNNSDQKYYVIKYIASVILTKNYEEYTLVSRFFYNLEAFHKYTFSGYISRIFQFGWVIFFIGLLGWFLPFGVLIWCIALGITLLATAFFKKVSPNIFQSLNFQLKSYLIGWVILSLCLWGSLGYKDNLAFTYEKVKPLFNLAILPTHESMKILKGTFSRLTGNILWSSHIEESSEPSIGDVDYLKWESWYDLKYGK